MQLDAYTIAKSMTNFFRPPASAIPPMKLPKTIELPNPATNSTAMSCCEYPYASYRAYTYGPWSQSDMAAKRYTKRYLRRSWAWRMSAAASDAAEEEEDSGGEEEEDDEEGLEGGDPPPPPSSSSKTSPSAASTSGLVVSSSPPPAESRDSSSSPEDEVIVGTTTMTPGKYFFQYDEARNVTRTLKTRTAPKIKL
jgi:hypothetical protein